MKKSLAILALAVLFFNDVGSITDEHLEIADKLFAFGGESLLKFMDNIQNAAEHALKQEDLNRSGNETQPLWEPLKELIERTIASERAKGNQDDFLVATQVFHSLGSLFAEGIFRLTKEFHLLIEGAAFKGIFKNETLVELWRDVGSRYFPEAPPIYSDPYGFMSYVLSKIVLKSNILQNLKAASEMEIIEQLNMFDALRIITLIREKATEIASLEKQTEKNELVVKLRTASGVFAFFWDKFLEHTESKTFHEQYTDSERMLKKNCYSETEDQALKWTDNNFGYLLNNVGQEYYRWGDKIFGSERFNQSNRAFSKLASVYRLPFYEKLCDNGLGVSVISNILNSTNAVLNEVGGEEIMKKPRNLIYKWWTWFENVVLSTTKKSNMIPNEKDEKHPLQHLHTIKGIFFDIWDKMLSSNRLTEKEIIEYAGKLDEVKNTFIKELIISGELTQEKLEEAQISLIKIKQVIFEKYVKKIDGLGQRIDATDKYLGEVLLQIFSFRRASTSTASIDPELTVIVMIETLLQLMISTGVCL